MRPALLALVAALLLAAPAHAATVANPGPVTLTGGSPAGDVGGYSPALSFAGSVDSDGNLLFPAAGIDPVVLDLPDDPGGNPAITNAQVTLSPTHDGTGSIDPAAGAVDVLGRFDATITAHVVYDTGLFEVAADGTCVFGDAAAPVELPLGTAPLDPPGPDAPQPYDQLTGSATLVGQISGPALAGDDCSLGGGFLATFADAFKGYFVGMVNDLFYAVPHVVAARFDPAPRAPGFTPPSDPLPSLQTTVTPPQLPSNAFKVGAAALSSSKGSATLTLDLPGPGTVTALATATVPAGAAKKITVAKLTRRATRAGKLKLTLKPSKAALRHLKRRGRLRTSVKLTYTPTGGSARSTTRKVTLKLKRKRR